MYTITLTVGDPWRDGHGRSYMFIYECNMDHETVFRAYNAGTKAVGFDLNLECNDNAHISLAVCETIESLFPNCLFVKSAREEEYKLENWYLCPEEFADLYWAIALRGNPQITYKDMVRGNLNIGGYGLFND